MEFKEGQRGAHDVRTGESDLEQFQIDPYGISRVMPMCFANPPATFDSVN